MVERNTNIEVGLLGAGGVGSKVYELSELQKEDSPKISKVLVRDKSKKRDFQIPEEKLTTDVNEILNDDSVNIVVSILGNELPEREFILDSLEERKNVVTASKLVMAKYGQEIYSTAESNGVGIYYEAAVAGGIQVVDNLMERYSVNQITEITGIVNGTTNYILTKMANEGVSFADALAQAQENKYAEPDPTDDVEGFDARYKLALMATLAFRHGWVGYEDINCEGISGIDQMDFKFAKALNYKIKLIAQARIQEGKIAAWVAPTFVYNTHPLANIDNVTNAVLIRGNPVGDIKLVGPGAGGGPTAASVWSDVEKVGRQITDGVEPKYPNYRTIAPVHAFQDVSNRHYVRATISNEPGSIGKFTTIMGDMMVSIDEVLQPRFAKYGKIVEMAVTTEPSREEDVASAFKIAEDEGIIKIGSMFRVLDELSD